MPAKKVKDFDIFDLQCRVLCFCGKRASSKPPMEKKPSAYRFCFVIIILVVIHFYYNTPLYFGSKNHMKRNISVSEWNNDEALTSYELFVGLKHRLKNLGAKEIPAYSKMTPICKLNSSILGPISVNKTRCKLQWVEQLHPEVASGGFYAPPLCQSRHRVAILVPYRNRETNLAIFLFHIHPFLQKQFLEYRIFVIEQYGSNKFNKGSLYNVAFLESQRFGKWHCLVFHDVDLLPLDERILYSCPRYPTHMSPSVESQGYRLPYLKLFGGVTVMTPAQFDAVNGYSNSYWNWGAEDDDMFIRLQARRYPMLRYNISIGRYATLPHKPSTPNDKRYNSLRLAKRRFRQEGVRSIKYKLISITKRRLFTHILADVNPFNTKV